MMDYVLIFFSMMFGIGLSAVVYGANIEKLRLQLFEARSAAEKYRNQRDLWHRVADLPDEEEHKPVLTPEERERRQDIVDDVIDEHNL